MEKRAWQQHTLEIVQKCGPWNGKMLGGREVKAMWPEDVETTVPYAQ